MNKLSSPRLRGMVVLLSLLVISYCVFCPLASYAKGSGAPADTRPDGGGQEYYGTDSLRGGYQGGNNEQSPPVSVNSSPSGFLVNIILTCQLVGLSL
jgi:hypothetical protein